MQKNSFQTIILVIFGFAILVAVLIFAGVIPTPGGNSGTKNATGTVVLWGTYKQDVMKHLFDEFNQKNKTFQVAYAEQNPATFNQNLVEAIASNKGPDLIILPDNSIIRNSDKLYHIPYTIMTERSFRDTYVQEGELYLAPDGIIGLPLTVDPMIMYYNRNMFADAGIATPPDTWDDMVKDTTLLTKKDGNKIVQSAVGLGAYSNIAHAKDIIATLLMQTGNPIVALSGGKPVATLSGVTADSGGASESVLRFYTDFADPLKDTYTWNLSKPNSLDAFLGESLAVYFGYVSELPGIVAKNPNLNFDVARMPNIASSTTKVTFGRMNAVAVVKTSHNPNTAIVAAQLISSPDFSAKLTAAFLTVAPVAPAHKVLLSQEPQTLYGPLLFKSALIARSWRDPGDAASGPVFSGLIEDIVRGALSVGDAIGQANGKLNLTLPKS